MKDIIFLVGILTLTMSFSSFAQTRAEFKSVLDEKPSYEFCERGYLKRVDTNSVLIFFQSTSDNEKTFGRGLLIESNDDLSWLSIENGNLYDVIISQDHRFLILASTTSAPSIIAALYDVHDKVHSIVSNFTNIKPLVCFAFGISYMKNEWDKYAALNSSFKESTLILTEANNRIEPEVKKTLMAELLADPSPAPICHSGGVGSTQCNVEQGFPTTNVCGVSCNAGYYACCNTSTFTCKCYPNPK